MERAVAWALNQNVYDDGTLNKHKLVDKVRDYLNVNDISYDDFSYSDIKKFLN